MQIKKVLINKFSIQYIVEIQSIENKSNILYVFSKSSLRRYSECKYVKTIRKVMLHKATVDAGAKILRFN